MMYLVITDNTIEAVDSSLSLDAVWRRYEPCTVYPRVNNAIYSGMDARAVNWSDQSIKPLSQQVGEGLIVVPSGSILDGETIRTMTQVERIEAGLDSLPAGLKIESGALVAMTRDERYVAGQITAAQYNTEARAERQARYTVEADRLYMEYVYDTEAGKSGTAAKKKLWIDKVNEIKAALPLKEAE